MQRFISFLLLIFLTGCSTKVGPLSKFQPISLAPADVMPTKSQLKDTTTKVILFKVDDSRFRVAKKAGLGQTIGVDLVKKLGRGGGIEIIDRTAASSLEDEIRLAELSSDGGTNDVELSVASYALKPEISGASFGSHYTAPVVWKDKEGKEHKTPAFFTYTADVSGVVKVFGVPSMKILKVVSFAGTATSREVVNNRTRRKQSDDALMQKASRFGINNSRITLLNFLAPKGYVLAKRIKDDDTIVQITLGSANGIKQDDSVIFYTMITEENPLSGEIDTIETRIAEGVATEHISANKAWVKIDEESRPIRLGDYTKKRYESSFFDAF